MIETIKKLLKTKQAKIGLSVVCVAAILAIAFFAQPAPDSSVPVADSSVVTSSEPDESASSDKMESFGLSSAVDSEISSEIDASTEEASSDSSAKTSPSSSSASSASTSDTGKDPYQTDPVPEGKPEPVEPEDTSIDENKQYSCTISIRCDTIFDNMDLFNKEKLSVLPSDGVILSATTVSFHEGESVFDVLKRVTQEKQIQMESSFTPMFNAAYIEGIHNIYEFDCGDLSGWRYKVNGWLPNYGCNRYQLKQGDVIEWVYTCDSGKDVGGYSAGQGESK